MRKLQLQALQGQQTQTLIPPTTPINQTRELHWSLCADQQQIGLQVAKAIRGRYTDPLQNIMRLAVTLVLLGLLVAAQAVSAAGAGPTSNAQGAGGGQ